LIVFEYVNRIILSYSAKLETKIINVSGEVMTGLGQFIVWRNSVVLIANTSEMKTN